MINKCYKIEFIWFCEQWAGHQNSSRENRRMSCSTASWKTWLALKNRQVSSWFSLQCLTKLYSLPYCNVSPHGLNTYHDIIFSPTSQYCSGSWGFTEVSKEVYFWDCLGAGFDYWRVNQRVVTSTAPDVRKAPNPSLCESGEQSRQPSEHPESTATLQPQARAAQLQLCGGKETPGPKYWAI